MPAFERSAVPNPNANTANAITKHFFPIIPIVPPVVSPIEPDVDREVARENVGAQKIAERLKEEGWKTAQSAAVTDLFFFDQRKKFLVTSVFHLIDRNKMKGGGVNDVPSAGGRLRVGKDVAKAGITALGANLEPLHLVCVVGHLDKQIIRNGFRERGQADFTVELIDRSEKRFAANDIDVNADLLAGPELILKRGLRTVFPHYAPFLGL